MNDVKRRAEPRLRRLAADPLSPVSFDGVVISLLYNIWFCCLKLVDTIFTIQEIRRLARTRSSHRINASHSRISPSGSGSGRESGSGIRVGSGLGAWQLELGAGVGVGVGVGIKEK